MTGEMAWIKPDGTDSNGDCWPIHASIARQLKGELRPFDVYQGPYIKVGRAKLWVCGFDDAFGYTFTIYREDTDTVSKPLYVGYTQFSINRRACKAARELIAER